MFSMFIAIAVFVGVAALVGGVAMLFREQPGSKVEDRLDLLTGTGISEADQERAQNANLLNQPLDSEGGVAESLFGRLGNFELLFDQADTSLTLPKLLLISAVVGVAGAGLGIVIGSPLALIPVFTIMAAFLPLAWIFWRRKRRLKAFAVQLPDALEMLSRSLRAGQSLGAGFNMVASEMSPPIGKEFGRVFEEQNLGVPLEETLKSLTERIPNLDLKFFATAIVLQRQTGGNLAEILDKIGHLIRERFQIWGQIQALTGEGRLSGIVLMALPILLFVTVYYLNPEYIMQLFTDPLGKAMLAAAIGAQIVGALVIRKIVNIKV